MELVRNGKEAISQVDGLLLMVSFFWTCKIILDNFMDQVFIAFTPPLQQKVCGEHFCTFSVLYLYLLLLTSIVNLTAIC